MFKATRALMRGGILGKLFGIMRELILAALFGTSAQIDAYRAALTGTMIPANFFLNDSLNAGFIPLYTRYLREDRAKADALFWSLNLLLGVAGLMVTGALLVAAGPAVRLLVPGFSAEALALTAQFVRVMALGLPFYIQSALFAYLEMGHARYTLQSLRASAQSVGLIAGTLLAFWLRQPVWLAWGFTGAYVVFAVTGGIVLWRARLLAWPGTWSWPAAGLIMGEFGRVIRPLLLLPVMMQGNTAVERIVASLLGVGVVASLDYAKMIAETGLVLIAVPVGLASLAELSRVDAEVARERLGRILTPMLLLLVPLSAFLALNCEQVVRLLYRRGAFNEESVALTQAILLGSSVGFWAWIISAVFVKALNAQMRNREAVLFMGVAFGINVTFNLCAWRYLGPITLGLGTSIYALVLFALSARALHLGDALRRCAAPLVPGVVLYIALARWVRGSGPAWFAAAAGLFAVYWLAFVMLVPSMRNVVSAVWAKRSAA
jgi:putative peptidoglycan lipid II flippase